MSDKVTVSLGRPIQAHGEEVHALEFREPTGKDIRRLGLPFTVVPDLAGGEDKPEVNTGITARYISELAGIPTASVDQLAPKDWLTAMGAVLGFFGATPERS